MAGCWFMATLSMTAALMIAAPVHATPDCADDVAGSPYCADGTCHQIEVSGPTVQCLDNALPPLLPSGPPVEFEIGVGAGS